jgi:hypothetical protein
VAEMNDAPFLGTEGLENTQPFELLDDDEANYDFEFMNEELLDEENEEAIRGDEEEGEEEEGVEEDEEKETMGREDFS